MKQHIDTKVSPLVRWWSRKLCSPHIWCSLVHPWGMGPGSSPSWKIG